VNKTDVFILNVGAGSCAVIDHPSGRRTMVDINNGGKLRSYEREAFGSASNLAALAEAALYEAKLVNPIDWYRERFGTSLWRFILSHPDADHMAGIRHLLNGEINVDMFWDLEHTRQIGEAGDYQNEAALRDAIAYYAFHWQIDKYRLVSWPYRLSPMRFEQAHYWADDHIEILSPSQALLEECNQAEKWNNASFALRVNHGGRSVLIPGDIEEEGWLNMAGACMANNVPLKTDVLVAAHHGRKSGYPSHFVMAMLAPETVIVSTAKLKPEHDAIPLYRARADDLYSTRTRGSLLIRMWDDGELEIFRGVDSIADTPERLKSTWPQTLAA
jgi:competence protein ComEC